MINKTMTQVRVIVRAGSQDICRTGAETAVGFLQRCFAKFGSSYEISVKVSCSSCRQDYVDLSVVQEAAAQGKTERECGRCHRKRLSVDDLLNGFKDTRPIEELVWHPYHRLQHPGLYWRKVYRFVYELFLYLRKKKTIIVTYCFKRMVEVKKLKGRHWQRIMKEEPYICTYVESKVKLRWYKKKK